MLFSLILSYEGFINDILKESFGSSNINKLIVSFLYLQKKKKIKNCFLDLKKSNSSMIHT